MIVNTESNRPRINPDYEGQIAHKPELQLPYVLYFTEMQQFPNLDGLKEFVRRQRVWQNRISYLTYGSAVTLAVKAASMVKIFEPSPLLRDTIDLAVMGAAVVGAFALADCMDRRRLAANYGEEALENFTPKP